jgi:hypothetical protein
VKAHVLFSDGTSAALRVELDSSTELKVFMLGHPSRDVLLSAERGATAAYFALRRRALVHHPYASFFEFEAPSGPALGVLGESAGLCFALAFAAHVLDREHARAEAVAFAATGVVRGASLDAELGGVDRLPAKVEAAARALPEGGWIFLPTANGNEVSDEQRRAVERAGLRLVPVRTVEEGVERLAAAILGGRARRRTGRAVLVGAVCAVMLLVAGWAFLRGAAGEREERLTREVHAGEFANLGRARSALAWLPGNGGVLETDARRELTVLVSLQSLSAGHEVDGVPELRAGDRYRLALEPSRDSYLYAVQIDSWGNGAVLFPNAELSGESNPLRGGSRHWLPDGGRWLTLDERPGKETVVVVASPWPAEDVEALLARAPKGSRSASRSAGDPELFGAIWKRAVLRKDARLGGLRGIAYEEMVFAHR